MKLHVISSDGVEFSSSMRSCKWSQRVAVKPTWQIEIVSAVYSQLVHIPGGVIILAS